MKEKMVDDMKQGTWVLNEDMHPMTNIAGRKFRDAAGREHIAHSFPLSARPYAWWFPAEPTVTPNESGAVIVASGSPALDLRAMKKA